MSSLSDFPFARLMAVGLLLALSACAAPQDGTAPRAGAPVASAGQEPAEGAAHAALLAPAQEAAPEPVRPHKHVPARTELLGVGPDQLRGHFGAPDLLRREPPAQVWQYAGESCVLHLFLYEEKGAWRVEHVEIHTPRRSAERGTPPDEDCLGALVRASEAVAVE